MRRLVMLAMALAGLTALLGGCGGGEEASVLAVAFRLDEGSPVMSAYIGDPAKDPFWLPAGRYYIEALDRDEVFLSLGAVTVKDGEAVDLPPPLAAAGGVADPEQAESLKTLANFLVDADLAEYAFLEIVTGGFELPPFDPAVQVEVLDVERLFGMYEEILAQKDGVLAAFRQIQGRAEVSGHSPFVSSRWAQDGEDLGRAYEKLGKAFVDWETYLRAAREEEFDTEASRKRAILEQTNWVVGWYQDFVYDEVGSTVLVKKSPEMLEKHKEWEAYAKNLVQNLPGAEDEAAVAQAEKALADAIRSDLEEWAEKAGKGLDEYQIKAAVDYFVKEVSGAVGGPAGTAAPPTPDTSWIEGYVQVAGEQWVDEGYGEEAVVAAEKLKECLTKAVKAGASRDEAIAKCPAETFRPKVTPEPTGEEAEVPAPEEPAAPEPEEPSEPAPEEPTALNRLTDLQVSLGILGEGDEPGTVGVVVTVRVSFELGEEDATVTCGSQSQLSGLSLAVHRPEAYASVELGRDDVRPGQDYTVSCSISDGNTLSTTVKLPGETPTPEPTETPEGQEVTAVGRWVNISLPGLSLNTVTLRFNTAGGPVSGEGYTTSEIPFVGGVVSCPPGTLRQTDDFEGTYSPETGEFVGTFNHSAEGSYYTPVFKEDNTYECEERPHGQAPTSGSWHGTLEDGVVVGYRGAGESGEKFELTVQGS